MTAPLKRRTFLAQAAAAGIAQTIHAQTERKVRVGMVGVGRRGTSLLKTILDVPGVEIPALGEINEASLSAAASLVEKSGRPRPESYGQGVEDFRRLVARKDLDAVINAIGGRLSSADVMGQQTGVLRARLALTLIAGTPDDFRSFRATLATGRTQRKVSASFARTRRAEASALLRALSKLRADLRRATRQRGSFTR